METNESLSLDDPRVIRASRDYLAELEAGMAPDRQRYYQLSPDLKSILAEVFDGIDIAQSMRPKPTMPSETLAEPLGDFRIIRELGRGGMGVVYEAVQSSLGRHVALKVLPFSAALDARQRQRFQIEAKAAALLHHSNIVPIYAVGYERGLHFYAMQLIEGGSLADWIASRKQVARPVGLPKAMSSTTDGFKKKTKQNSEPQQSGGSQRDNRSSVRTIVELVIKVAEALDYAHQAGTIHRDIKPANLMLDHLGQIWITDFGLAHVAADASLTMTGDVLGTMRYMSPEQASGQRVVLDGRTDIYSLGATLYELLTLQPVFSSSERQTLLYSILNEEPTPLRRWDRTIPVELETIVLKCLSKSPSERYSKAVELADDLRRFLEERPVLARRPTLLVRFRKWLKRHPAYGIAASLVMISGVIGLAITTAIVAQEQKLTQAALDRERLRATEAESRFQLARSAADEMIQIAQNELSDMPFQDGARKRLLQGALKYYQQFVELKPNSSPDQEDLKDTRNRVADILADLTVLETGRQTVLVREDDVLDDLDVTPEQRQQLVDIASQTETRLGLLLGPHREGSGQFKQELIQLARQNHAAISKILTPDQMKRLRQIAIQWEGLKVFFEPEIGATLGLTVEQKQEIRQIERVCLFGAGPPFGPPPRKGGPPDRAAMQNAINQALLVLTSEQRQAWEELIGRPFQGRIRNHHHDDREFRRPE